LIILAAMYLEHFGLLEPPFSIAPDPRYLYMSERHREALAHLLYGLESDGAFILLTGDVGTGKTTVSRCLLEQVPEKTSLALVLNPKLSATELLQVICDELHIPYDATSASIKSLVDAINRYLLEQHAQGRNTVVLIEEAQNLDLDVLEQLRLLTNLETNDRKLLQVILLGQPEFLDVLDRPELAQLAQRVTARFHLSPLNFDELKEYVGHRLAVAGCRRPLLSVPVLKQLFHYSGGVPRVINVICDRALLGAFVQGVHRLDKKTLVTAAREVLGEKKAGKLKKQSSSLPSFWAWAGIVLIALLMVALVYTYQQAFEADLMPVDDSTLQDIEKMAAVVEAEIITEEPVVALENPSIIQWADESLRLRSNLLSYQALFARWGIDYQLDVHGTPCFHARTQGLACSQETADFASLQKLNRPAVIKLYDDFNQVQFATLLEITDADNALLFLNNKRQRVSIEQLLYYWKGEFSVFWKMPPAYQDVIKPGDSGDVVLWIARAINRIENKPEADVSQLYGVNLVNRVKAFQLSQGLVDDGVVGMKTIIYLNQMTDSEIPLLETLH